MIEGDGTQQQIPKTFGNKRRKNIHLKKFFHLHHRTNKMSPSSFCFLFCFWVKRKKKETKIVIIPHLKAKSIRNNSREVELKKKKDQEINIGPNKQHKNLGT